MARRVSVIDDECELTLDGKSSPKRRARRKQDITDEQIETFFATLADTCNVMRSAKAAQFTANWAYRKRKLDAGFRAGWARAVAEGYAKLELVLLDRAMNGMVKRVPSGGGGEKHIREYPNQLAMALLKRHSDTAASIDNMLSEEEAEDVRERILAKLAKKRERDEREDEATDGRG